MPERSCDALSGKGSALSLGKGKGGFKVEIVLELYVYFMCKKKTVHMA